MVAAIIQVGDRFTKRRDGESCFLQRYPVGFERLTPASKMHPQTIALLHTFKAFPAEVMPSTTKGEFISLLAKRP